MGRIVVVGSSNTDLTVVAERLPSPGETVLGDAFTAGPGGKGANQAIAARRLGSDVTFVTKLGDDRFGDELRDRFEREGLPPAGILAATGTPTGVALIVVDDGGRNMIAVAPGANALLAPHDLLAVPGVFDAASHLLVQLETPVETFVAAARTARSAGAAVVLDPAPARPLPEDAYGLVDVMTPNAVELAALTGLHGESDGAVQAAARTLLDRGVGTVVTTLGEGGCMAVWPGGTLRVPARMAGTVDTTGCGDAFVAGLVTGLAADLGLLAALDLGTRAGAYCATRLGVLDGLPTRADLDREMPP